MKAKIGLSFILFLFSVVVVSQTINITKQYNLFENGVAAYHPVLNVNGDKLLFTTDSYQGLSLYNLSDKVVTKITDNQGAGYEPIIDAYNSKVFYRITSFDNGRKMDAIESYNFNDMKKQQMLAPHRDLKQARNFHNGFIVTADRKLIKSIFGVSTKALPVYVTTQDLKIYLYKNAKFQLLNPLNESDSRYLWVSLSPNSQMILFTAAGKGAFVCDLNGKIVASLGYLNAPVWYNDNFVIGMQDKDDGHVITSSKVILLSLNGKSKTQISSNDEIAMYPTASAVASEIAYCTIDGKIIISEISIK